MRLAWLIGLALAGFAAMAVCAGLRTAPAPSDVVVDGFGVLVTRDGLHARIGAAIEQRLGGCTMRTTRDELAVGCGDAHVVARRGAAWTAVIGADDAAVVARVVALDAAYAVQGTALVFGGAAYVPCTQRCSQAQRCGLARCTGAACSAALARCADDVVTCAACLERAP